MLGGQIAGIGREVCWLIKQQGEVGMLVGQTSWGG